MKYPNYLIKSIFLRIIPKSSEVPSSNNLLLNGVCPLCVKKQGKKFYLKEYPDTHMVYCHRCGYSCPFYVFIKDYHPEEITHLKEYYLESIKTGEVFKENIIEKKPPKIIDKWDNKLRLYAYNNGFSLHDHQENPKKEDFRQICLKLCKDRCLTKDFCKDLWCCTNGPLKGYLVIPFYNDTKELIIHYQGRRIFKVKKELESLFPKYLFLKDLESGIEIENKPLWGTWRVDRNRNVIITEGAIDASMFDNGIATNGASISDSFLTNIKTQYPFRIWCPDNYWHDEAGRELTQRLLSLDESCLVFPKNLKEKDANDYVINGGKLDNDFIVRNTYHGSMGLNKLKIMGMKYEGLW